MELDEEDEFNESEVEKEKRVTMETTDGATYRLGE